MRTKHLLGTLLLFLSVFSLRADTDYWQQSVDYDMEIDFDANTHQFTGRQQLAYVNHSPDTLERVFYHLYFNAFQPGSMMDVRSRTIEDPDGRVGSQIAALQADEIGYQRINSLKHNGRAVSYAVEGTILVVELEDPILPGESAYFDMQFESQVPIQIRRSGRNNREGIDYSMAQWYPKICEYDHEGWHSNPYIGREFHGVWGNFDVEISIDAKYMVAATGYLQNPEAIGKGYGPNPEAQIEIPESGKLNWHFVAEMVHDFVWTADPDYIHDRLQVPGGPELHFFYQPNVTENWQTMKPYAVRCFQIMNETFGEYPYKKYSIIQGGDGGMEYAMATLIRGEGSINGLIGVTVHESIHSWYQHVLATNESLYSWMDEGFTSYAEDYVMNQFRQTPVRNPHFGSYLGYLSLVERGEEPSTTHSDHYNTNYAYGRAAYSKGAVCLHQLGYVIGEEILLRGMKRYFNTWKFRHPTVREFKRVMEKESGMELDWYFEYWITSTKTIDYALTYEKGGKSVTLSREGLMPMPIDLLVTYKDGSQEYYYIPMLLMRGEKSENPYPNATRIVLPDWPWVQPAYQVDLPKSLTEVESIVIDPSFRLADIERQNNYYPKVKKDKKEEIESYGANLPPLK